MNILVCHGGSFIELKMNRLPKMIIKAKHHWLLYPFFKFYSRWMPARNFSNVQIHYSFKDAGLPMLMLGNHISWWDGFLAQYVNIELFNRKLHIMMLEEQLEKRMFLNKTGAYSIKKGDRSAVESLRYSSDLLKDPNNLVILFPQGKIHSMFDYPVTFEKGWHRIVTNLEGPVQVVFFITLIDYFSSSKPQLNIYLYNYAYEGKSLEEMNIDFNTCLSESIEIQKSMA